LEHFLCADSDPQWSGGMPRIYKIDVIWKTAVSVMIQPLKVRRNKMFGTLCIRSCVHPKCDLDAKAKTNTPNLPGIYVRSSS